MSTIKVNKIENTSTTDGGVSIDNDGHVTIDGQQMPTSGALSDRNLIINGAHVIQQRGNPSSGHSVYPVDRFRVFNDGSTSALTVSQSSDSPAGFENSSKVVVSSAMTAAAAEGVILRYIIEGYDAAQLDLGTAAAKTFTLSFWVKSTLTGTFSGSFTNGNFDRGQSYEYTINSANTWEYKTLTIAGDTAGSWDKTNGRGLRIYWDLGSGSNYEYATGSWLSANVLRTSGSVSFVQNANAEFYLTGVQLEVGSKSTPFSHRSYGDELAKCQRYYQKTNNTPVFNNTPTGTGTSAIPMWYSGDTNAHTRVYLPVRMRTPPSASFIGNESAGTALQGTYVSGADGTIAMYYIGAWQSNDTWTLAVTETTENSVRMNASNLPRGAAGHSGGLYFYGSASTATVTLDAEL